MTWRQKRKDEDDQWKNSVRRLISVEEEEKIEENGRKEDRKTSVRRKSAILVLCTCGVFNDALSNPNCITLNNELEKLAKEAVLAGSEVRTRPVFV
jgi:hypothetical protein